MNIKSFDDLDITDPIMFGLVFSNKHIAKPFIEHLLDIENMSSSFARWIFLGAGFPLIILKTGPAKIIASH